MFEVRYKTDAVFILKERIAHYGGHLSSGLANSIAMLVKMLRSNSVDAVVSEVVDGNCIDRVVTLCRPRVAIIEALWATPDKLKQLARLHPSITWIVRIHSDLPFISGEGMAMKWIGEIAALYQRVQLATNSREMHISLNDLYDCPVLYLPNYYDVEVRFGNKKPNGYLDVSCFGAIRPLKNQLIQAVAAILYADTIDRPLRFHINASRIEHGDSILKNLRSVFADQQHHELVEHGWLSHKEFKKLIRAEIDLGMQVSYSETYNIVSADHIDCGVPMVTSSEVEIVDYLFHANPNSVRSIVCAMEKALKLPGATRKNTRQLQRSNVASEAVWRAMFPVECEV